MYWRRICSGCGGEFLVERPHYRDLLILCPACQPASIKRAHAIATRDIELAAKPDAEAELRWELGV